ARLDRGAEAEQVLSELMKKVQEHPALKAEVLMQQADLAAAAGKNDSASSLLNAVLEQKIDGTTERTARTKLAGLKSQNSGPAIFSYFRPGHEELKLLRLREALDREQDNPYL